MRLSWSSLVLVLVLLAALAVLIAWAATAQAQAVGGELPDDGGPTGGTSVATYAVLMRR